MFGQTSDCFKAIAMLNLLKWYSYEILLFHVFYLLIFEEMFDLPNATCVRHRIWERGRERREI